MNKLNMAFLALMSLFALGMMAVSASAETLPLLSPIPNSFTGTSGAGSLLLEGTEMACGSSTNEGGTTSERLGTFKIVFSGCKNAGKTCASLGHAASTGVIEVTGTWHLVRLKTVPTHRYIWLLLAASDNTEALHLECEVAGLMLIWGSLLGLILEISTLTWKLDIEREGTGSTVKQKSTQREFGNNSGETVTVTGIKGKLGTGTERLGGEEIDDTLIHWTNDVTITEP